MGNCLALALLLGATAYAQDKPLGDVAREQLAVHAQQKKATSVHTDIAHSSSAAESSDRRLGEKPDPYLCRREQRFASILLRARSRGRYDWDLLLRFRRARK